MSEFIRKSPPIRIPKPEDFPPRPAPPEPGPELPAQPRNSAPDLEIERAEIVNEAFDLVMSRLGSAPKAPDPVYADHAGTSYPWTRPADAPLLPAPDALMSDWGPVGDDITGDMLLDAFEQDEAEAASVIQVLSATRQRHLSEQLNVEKARLRREHMLTDQANPREASIDRLLGLLTRRGD
jgi:hypothetical protein